MLVAVILLAVLPTLVICSGEGNIKLLEDEVATALKACAENDNNNKNVQRQKRYTESSPHIDDRSKQGANQYSHERRNASDMRDQIFVINATDYDYDGYGAGNEGEKLVNSMPNLTNGGNYSDPNDYASNRTRRSEPLFTKPDNDQVDSRGIPREAELWNKVQSSVTSQQSRAALRDQINACFQELQSEAEDNGCSYSNKLERCLMLRFSDRKLPGQTNNGQKTQT